MASKKHHYILWGLGLAAGGFVAYEYVYKPWQANQALLAASGGSAAGSTGLASLLPDVSLPSPASLLTTPTSVVVNPSSNLDPGAAVGGVVGACMQIKDDWTETQCSTRLNQLVAAWQNAQDAISQLQAAGNPAAAGIPAAQAALAAEQAALMVATTNYNNAVAAKNVNDAATWSAAMQGHQSDINDLTARIAAASAPANNNTAIATWQAAQAAAETDYGNLTNGAQIAA